MSVELTPEEARVIIQRSDVLAIIAESDDYDYESPFQIGFERFESMPKHLDLGLLKAFARFFLDQDGTGSGSERSFQEIMDANQKTMIRDVEDYFMMKHVGAFKAVAMQPNMDTFIHSLDGPIKDRALKDRTMRRTMHRPGFYDNTPYVNLIQLTPGIDIAQYHIPRPSCSSLASSTSDPGDARRREGPEGVRARQQKYDRYMKIDLPEKFEKFLGRGFPWYTADREHGFVVAGGFLTNLLYGTLSWNNLVPTCKQCDIDFFYCVSNSERYNTDTLKCNLFSADFIHFANLINDTLPRSMRFRFTIRRFSKSSMVINGYIVKDMRRLLMKLQFILRVFETPSHVLHGFDLEPCKILFDGTHTHVHPNFMNTLATNWMLLDQDKLSTSWYFRYGKYSMRYDIDVLLPGISDAVRDALVKHAQDYKHTMYRYQKEIDGAMKDPILKLITCLTIRWPCNSLPDYDHMENAGFDSFYAWVGESDFNYYMKHIHQFIHSRIKRFNRLPASGKNREFTGAFNPIEENIYRGVIKLISETSETGSDSDYDSE